MNKQTLAFIIAIIIEVCMMLFTSYLHDIHADLTYPAFVNALTAICSLVGVILWCFLLMAIL